MTYLNPPNPLFKGAHQAFVRTRARDHRFAVLRPASDDACYFIGTLSQTISLNSPDPLFKGAIRAYGLSIAARLSLLANSGPASDDALLVPLICKNYLSVIPFSMVLSISPGRTASPDSILLP